MQFAFPQVLHHTLEDGQLYGEGNFKSCVD